MLVYMNQFNRHVCRTFASEGVRGWVRIYEDARGYVRGYVCMTHDSGMWVGRHVCRYLPTFAS